MSVLTFSFWTGTPLPLEAMMNDWGIVCGKEERMREGGNRDYFN
jgi:hypothetical protein